MINTLVQFHNHLPFLIRWPFDFLFEFVLLRGILAPKLLSDIKQSGLLRINIIHDMVHIFNKFIPDADSRKAIAEHWHRQAKGDGHEAATARDCFDGKCGELFRAV